MSDYLIKMLTNKIVASLPKEKREIYAYVINMEDEFAEEADSAEEFMVRLKSESPHKHAAKHFGMTFFELLQTINHIDREIAGQLETRIQLVSWKDYTEVARAKMGIPLHQKVFLLSL
ncbi:hypothetical protein GCM10010954_28540 [Halobacillus andaensis]|uniref:Uncharacterized protein n=1 Tax=Halobacillus andaensis TaxID=1176239 RepID=A0A917EZ68_HALAA|nr:hypothetical protein [Halobacillus andaensis]MBP2006486.1 CII-binding regulator of phage lambda lysogenization HflD [Halobacillus andaensis]GGF27715.1 hypothetical protein GCM10010954_28540 [Halobacillus andaensis]